MGEQVVLRGTFEVKPSKYQNGFEVLLIGDFVGTYKAREAKNITLARNHARVRLGVHLKSGSKGLWMICTDTGLSDAEAACRKHLNFTPWKFRRGNFASKEDLLKLVRDIGAREDCTALAIVRGGGDAKGLEIWNDQEVVAGLLALSKPIYTALGHSTNLLLADRYSDEPFDTPTSFESAVGQIIQSDRETDERFGRMKSDYENRLKQLEGERAAAMEAAHRLTELKADHEHQIEELRQSKATAASPSNFWRLTTLLLVIAILLFLGYSIFFKPEPQPTAPTSPVSQPSPPSAPVKSEPSKKQKK